MGKLLQRLQDASKSGVYRASRDAEVLEALPAAAKLSLKGARTKAELLGRLGEQLKLPEWWGRNWDALEDCLAERDGHLLLYDYREIPADDLGVLIDVLGSAAEFWAGQGKPFFAVFVDPQHALGLPDLFREA
jgi:hypothetical protein